jgi:hypothetical protein
LHPFAIIFDESVCEDEKFSHNSDKRYFGRFSGGFHLFVFLGEIRVEPDGQECRHVECIAQWLATSLDESLPTPAARLARLSCCWFRGHREKVFVKLGNSNDEKNILNRTGFAGGSNT